MTGTLWWGTDSAGSLAVHRMSRSYQRDRLTRAPSWNAYFLTLNVAEGDREYALLLLQLELGVYSSDLRALERLERRERWEDNSCGRPQA